MIAIQEIESQLVALRQVVAASGSAQDLAYFDLHSPRFARAAASISEIAAAPARILDVGSHYLHQATLLRRMGYDVVGMDVAAFATLPFVELRARNLGMVNEILDFQRIADGDFMPGEEDRFDAILLCETMEHITFNPIRFWRRIYELLRVGGSVYVTTPNSLRLLSFLGALWRMASFSGTGLPVGQIMHHVTYGHHWKEYSPREIRQYFARLSDDFEVEVTRLSYADPATKPRSERLDPVRETIRRIGNASHFFAEHLEAVVILRGRSSWKLSPPEFG